jgi:hypothetical protein
MDLVDGRFSMAADCVLKMTNPMAMAMTLKGDLAIRRRDVGLCDGSIGRGDGGGA